MSHPAFYVGKRCSILSSFVQEVLKYKFEEEPYYSKLRHLLKVQLLNLDNLPDQDIFYDIKKSQNNFNALSRETDFADSTPQDNEVSKKPEISSKDDNIHIPSDPEINLYMLNRALPMHKLLAGKI